MHLVHVMPVGGKPLERRSGEVVRYKGALYVVQEAEAEPTTLPGSMIAFTKNGVLQGVAYQDFLEGTYYPSAALYTLPKQAEGASVRFNFGPDFQFPAPVIDGWPEPLPVCALPAAAGHDSSVTTEPTKSLGAPAAAMSQSGGPSSAELGKVGNAAET